MIMRSIEIWGEFRSNEVIVNNDYDRKYHITFIQNIYEFGKKFVTKYTKNWLQISNNNGMIL